MRDYRWTMLALGFALTWGGCGGSSSTPDGGDGAGDVGGEDGTGDVAGDEGASEGLDAGDGDGEAEADGGELVWGPCDTTGWPAGYPLPATGVECTTVDVPLDYGNPAAGTIPLNVGRQTARNFPTGLAVFNLAGGPGGASVSQSGIIPTVMPELRADFDMVYVDQRGTGHSGYMSCPGGYPDTLAAWQGCAASYTDRDLNHYLTVDAANDLDTVRQRLGYDRIYLRGGSYGTRLGLEYMRQHGATVVAAVLDGLVPPDIDLFGSGVTMFDHGVDMLVADCAADPACLAVSPTLLDDLRTRRTLLHATPRPISIGGSPDVEDETYYLMFLQAFLYDAYWRFDIPRASHDSGPGDNTEWNRLMSDASGYTVTDRTKSDGRERARAPFDWVPRRRPWLAQDYVAPGLFITVACAEWLPNSAGVAALQTSLAAQEWPDDTHVVLAEACPSWDVNPIAATLLEPVVSDIPTLLMNGAIDLNTPQEWGPHAELTLSHGTNILVPFATHSTLSVPCAAHIMARFILNDGDMSAVDTSCLASVTHSAW